MTGLAAAVVGLPFALCLGVTAYLAPPHLLRARATAALRAACRRTRTLVLTYDDGPGEHLTPQLLDLLAARNAKATFLLLGRRAERQPGIIDRIVGHGHEVGCHSHRHLNAWKVPPNSAIADITAGYDALQRWVPADGLFRPPYGKMTLPTLLSIRRRRAPLAWWTLDSRDTKPSLPEPRTLAQRIAADHGGVVLLHDFDRDDPSGVRARFVLDATAALLDAAAGAGITPRTYGELLRLPAYLHA